MMKNSDAGSGLRLTGEGRGGGLRRALTVWVLLVILLLITVAVVVRLEGGQALISGYLERRLGSPVEIGASRIVWPYVLAIDNMQVEFDEGGSFAVAQLRVGFSGLLSRRIVMKEPEIVLVRHTSGKWSPLFFSGLGSVPSGSFADLTELTKPWRSRNSLEVRDGTVSWIDHAGEVITEMNGIRFAVRPVRLLARPYYAYEWNTYVIRDEAGLSAGNSYCLWLAGEHNDYIEIERRIASGDGRGWPYAQREGQ